MGDAPGAALKETDPAGLTLAAARVRVLRPEELAWVLAVPCAAVTIAAIVLVGPPLGHAFLAPRSERFFPGIRLAPEPVEHARYLLALLGGALLTVGVVLGARRRIALAPAATRALAFTARALLGVLLVLALLAQNHVGPRLYIAGEFLERLFTVPTLVIAGALAALLPVVMRGSSLSTRVARAARETRARRIGCLAIAVLLTATWLLTTFNTESTIGNSQFRWFTPVDMNETFAILDGRTTLVDFHALYARLWPYLAALVMKIAGNSSVGVWTATTAVSSGLALVAIYALFRRIVRSSPFALVLYLPFLATGFFVINRPIENQSSPAGIFSLWPMRYAAPYLVAWLVARHLDGVAPRRAWPLTLAAGLAVINNSDFGTAALAATLVALAFDGSLRSRRDLVKRAGEVAAGLLGAALLVSLLTLVRAGQLPDFGLLSEYPRLFAIGGLILEPMPVMGFHVTMYVTFVAAIAVAGVRAVRGGEQRVLTGMLAWSGVFGLLAGGYYLGRSDYIDLISLMSAWAFSLALLTVVVVRRLAARGWRRPDLAELAVLFGFGLAVCSLAQFPVPWNQVARLQRPSATLVDKQPAATRFVAARTRPGEAVAIVVALGHRIAYDLGLTNVSPYVNLEMVVTVEQLQTLLDSMRREHARRLFLESNMILPEELASLRRAGFAIAARSGAYLELAD
jgi:hypothetical protein